jgi:hypothetical protein
MNQAMLNRFRSFNKYVTNKILIQISGIILGISLF